MNGDGRGDILTSIGWFEQPASLAGNPVWQLHRASFGAGGAQMFAQDVNRDGHADLISGWFAHGYGMHWYEQRPLGRSTDFAPHTVLAPAPPPVGSAGFVPLQFSQLHALAHADVDGDGVADIVTGKTYYAHNGFDPGAEDPAVLAAFLLRREGARTFYEPLVIDTDSGVGRQVVARDLDGDGQTDIVSAGKKGLFVFLHR